MGESALRCLGCQGKLGPPIVDLRCEVCSIIFWTQDLLCSDRFPGAGARFVVPELRGAYYKALEVADSYQRAARGGSGPPRAEDKRETLDKSPDLQTTPKAKPAVKVEENPPKPTRGEESDKGSAAREDREEEVKEEKPVKREGERNIRGEGRGGEASSSARGPTPRRSRSRHSRDRRGELKRRRPGETSPARRGRASPSRKERKTRPEDHQRTREASREVRRASPLRPRSPPGPPPPRRDERDRWQGPIPAYINRRRSDEEPRRREAANKGKKKRRQQRIFSEFKAWRRREGRNRNRRY